MSNSTSKVVIKVENLGKKYVINHEKENSNDNFREAVVDTAKNVMTSLNPFSKSPKDEKQITTEDFWALNDVNFEINKGDKVGIIGRNGAGKSTLLKVLSRITEPTTGKIHINGRIASLLEVGTGFHPELTGRENIYLNGAILGMSRVEIKSKFDEIVAFSEVEKFLDTPVKRYSSGMYVRLAFSVAAHLEPEILIVDEVLAVGDLAFQKKCLGKMNDVAEDGRTIIFVSHNMAAIQKLCSKAIYLESGNIHFMGSVDDAINEYLNRGKTIEENRDKLLTLPRTEELGINVKLDHFQLYDSKNKISNSFKLGESFYIELSCIAMRQLQDLHFVVGIESIYGERIATAISQEHLAFSLQKDEVKKGILKIELCFTPGNYLITLAIREKEKILHDQLQQIGSFTIEDIREPRIINELCLPYGYINLLESSWNISK